MKKVLKMVCISLGAIVFIVILALGILSATEYRPEPVQAAEKLYLQGGTPAGRSLEICTWNIGYGGLGRESDFLMDGGKMVDPPSAQSIEENLSAVTAYMREHPADVWLLQEVDIDSSRTDGIDQFELIQNTIDANGAFACNYNCIFVPYPLPPIGKVETGIATFSSLEMNPDAQRIALPCPFQWPVRVANMKRCLLVNRMPVEGTDKELVFVNLHLEAYESGEGRIAQTKEMMTFLEAEYAKGNYVIAGGDFNQSFPGSLSLYPIKDTSYWAPGQLEETMLPEGWHYASDVSGATCRLLNAPYCEDTQLYVIDGFILSPNVEAVSVETVALDFENSDHNPVRLRANLK